MGMPFEQDTMSHEAAAAPGAPAACSATSEADVFVLALAFAMRAHREQRDKQGLPYILHPLQVAMRLRTWRERIVGVLHDVKEDCGVAHEQLLALGIPLECANAIEALSRHKGESYADFIERTIAGGELPMRVKLADLAENMRPDRRHPDQEGLSRRYVKAVTRISLALAEKAPRSLVQPNLGARLRAIISRLEENTVLLCAEFGSDDVDEELVRTDLETLNAAVAFYDDGIAQMTRIVELADWINEQASAADAREIGTDNASAVSIALTATLDKLTEAVTGEQDPTALLSKLRAAPGAN